MFFASTPRSFCACKTPSHDDWLKDLSFRRPTSVTRPTLSFAPPVAGVLAAAASVGVSAAMAVVAMAATSVVAVGASTAAVVGLAGMGVTVGLSAPHAASTGASSMAAAIVAPARPNTFLVPNIFFPPYGY